MAAGSSAMTKNPYHVRSTSMPSSSQPLALKVEQQLQKLRTWEASMPSSFAHQTAEILCEGLRGLSDLGQLVNDLLELPLTQQALFNHRHGKWAEEALDGCLGMLDACGAIRDLFMEMKESVQDLQSALRRREHGLGNKVRSYFSSKKKMKKEIERCLRASRRTESQCRVSPLFGDNQHPGVIVHVLRELRLIANFVFGAILSFVSASWPKTTSIGKCLVRRWVGMKRVACQGEVKMSEIERVDAALFALCSDKIFKDENLGCVQSAQMQLERLELNIENVKDRIDCVFPCLIKMRVSLLNIFND